jgi:hypothetical protein
LEISVGDEVAWSGTTKTSLGYITLVLNNGTSGDSVSITSEGDFGIDEVEIYTPA